jgi:hypothetical protein
MKVLIISSYLKHFVKQSDSNVKNDSDDDMVDIAAEPNLEENSVENNNLETPLITEVRF